MLEYQQYCQQQISGCCPHLERSSDASFNARVLTHVMPQCQSFFGVTKCGWACECCDLCMFQEDDLNKDINIDLVAVIAMLVPFFNDVVGLLGALGFWPLTVFLPIQMHLKQAGMFSFAAVPCPCLWILLLLGVPTAVA